MSSPAGKDDHGGKLQSLLTRQQKADAIREVRELLTRVRTDWEYKPPKKPPLNAPARASTRSSAASGASVRRTMSLRSGGLGAWRASDEPDLRLPFLKANGKNKAGAGAGDNGNDDGDESWDEQWDSLYDSTDTDDPSSSSDADDYDLDGFDDLDDMPRQSRSSSLTSRSVSYRRPQTPPKPISAAKLLRRRRKRKQRLRRRTGIWRQRVDDSDYEIPSTSTKPSSSPYKWDSPSAIPSPSTLRRERRCYEREQMRENPGLRLWMHRRDQWTGADSEGWVPIGVSLFRDNPMTQIVTPATYPDIYSRCVVNGAELPVPINLKIMIDALVQGWKKDDLWPPPSNAAAAAKATGPSAPIGLGLVPEKVEKPGSVYPPPMAAARIKGGNNGGGGEFFATVGDAAAETEANGVRSMSGRVRKYLGIR